MRDFVPINKNVSTGNVVTSNAAYTSQKELPLVTFLSI